jgi:hypothetical protein
MAGLIRGSNSTMSARANNEKPLNEMQAAADKSRAESLVGMAISKVVRIMPRAFLVRMSPPFL